MTKFEQRDSGLVVPADKPKEPPRKYGVMEIREETRRELAKQALGLLWRAMKLDCSSHIKIPDDYPYEDRRRLYQFIGETLLGDECQEGEVKT